MPKFVANLTMLYNELDFLDRFAAAAADGFTGVEFLFPYTYPKEAPAERLQGHGLAQALHNLPAGDWAGVGCEYKPKAKTADGLAWFDRYRGNRGHAA